MRGESHRRRNARGKISLALAVCCTLVACGGDDDADETTTTVRATTTSAATTSSTTTSSTTTTDDSTTSSTTRPTVSTTTLPPLRCVELLALGCDGEPVERLQRLLRSRIDRVIAVDGDFGLQTERALREFEDLRCPAATCDSDREIVVDGPEWEVLEGLPELPPLMEPSP
jgi:hypothetical protein